MALLALAAHARRSTREAGPEPDAVDVPSPIGWITLHASVPESSANGSLAIVLERVVDEPLSLEDSLRLSPLPHVRTRGDRAVPSRTLGLRD